MDKIKIGDTFTEEVRYSQNDVDAFAKITGDNNPIHINAEYAAKTIFGKPIVHGFLAGAVFSKVFGTQWPGEGTIYMSQEMSFRAPVFVDNDYTACFEVVEVDEVKHRAIIKCTLVNDETKAEVIIGKAKLQHGVRF
ncbi:MAG: MaoC family dehydratase [Bacteroidales bacterium]|jgi:acyl dehydratase|nr:MaoC family dehydratase [Bacteroidales bacterium]MDD3914767.1 MaoC family dehydratase [Bacteroidales bacterium]MDD4634194.1 MaoC family dehydratase [Bacteroidales bacterium]